MMRSNWLAVVLGMGAVTQVGCGEPMAGEQETMLAQIEQGIAGSSTLLGGACGGNSGYLASMSPNPGDARTGAWRVVNNTSTTIYFASKFVNPNSSGGIGGVTNHWVAPGAYKDFSRPSCLGNCTGAYISLGHGCGASTFKEYARIQAY